LPPAEPLVTILFVERRALSKDLKVTDKRIFTPEGDLRDEFRHLRDQPPPQTAPTRPEPGPAEPEGPPAAEPQRPHATAEAPGAAPQSASSDPRGGERGAPPEPSPRLELPGTPPGFGAPSFYDLVAVLAEPVSLYLGDIPLPDGQSAENLEMARLHIDLLDVLRQKTAGNLTAQESTVLEDVLYRLRLRYVQKRG
jgi:uncharacterized protein DUF1844